MSDKEAQKAVTRFFDNYAETFHSIYQVEKRPVINVMLDKFTRSSMFRRFEVTYQYCQKTGAKTLLDVGCGPGHHDVMLAKGLGMNIMGIDVAPSMVDIAKKNTEEHGVGERCKFKVSDFMDTRPDTKYDVVLSLGVVEYIMDPGQFIQKMIECSKGAVIFSLPVKWHWLTPQRVLRYKIRNCPLRFYSRSEILKLLQGLNVKKYEIEALNRDYLTIIKIG